MVEKYMDTVARYGNLAGTPTVLKGISGVSVSRGITKHAFDGDLYQHNSANLSEAPVVSFNTTDLKVILDATSLDMVTLTTTNQLELNQRHMVNGGAFVGGGSDIQKILSGGSMFVTSLSCSQGQPASLSVQAIGAWDGTNDPLAESKTATAPAEVVEDYAYTISAMKYGGSGAETIPIQSININFGIQAEPVSSDGELYPSKVYKTAVKTTISITSTSLSDYVDDAKGVTDVTDDLIIYFARLKEGGSRYADNTSEHIKMIVSGHHREPSAEGETSTMNFTALWDGTAALFSVATTSTIT